MEWPFKRCRIKYFDIRNIMAFQGVILLMFWLVVIVLCSAAVGFVLVVSYLTYLRHVKYGHIPGPPVKHFFQGHVNEVVIEAKLRGLRRTEIVRQMFLKYGEVVLLWIYHIPVLSVGSSEAIKEILVTKNYPKAAFLYDKIRTLYGQRFMGDGLVTNLDETDWRFKRRVMNPAFHRKYLKFMIPQMNSSCDIMIKKLVALANGKVEVHMLDELSRLTLDVIAKVAFGVDFNVIIHEDAAFSRAFNVSLESANDAPFSSFLDKIKFGTSKEKKTVEAIKILREAGQKAIQERQEKLRNGEDLPQDLLTCILKTCESDDVVISMENFVDEFVTFFFAGHDTTTSLLSFFLMELNDHPEIEERLLTEMNDVMGERSEVGFSDVTNLNYTGLAIKEILRLHPPVQSVMRVTAQEETIASYVIPEGTILDVNFYYPSHHPGHFEEPFQFKPERWESIEQEKFSQYTWMPFSVGPRNCIGQTFAQIEAKVILTRLLREFKFSLVEGQTKSVVERLITSPRDGVICTLKPHENS